jgi:hypothetical protein
MTQNSGNDATHAAVEGAQGQTVTFPDGTMDSRALARAALASGSITIASFAQRMNRLANYEQHQLDQG